MDPFRKLYYTLRSVGNHPLKRGAKWKAIREFCIAQVAVRLVPGDVCVAFPNETKLLISPRMKGAAHFISPGLCEFDEMCFVMHFLREGEVFADVGANVGAYTVLASGVAGAKSVSFEPSPSTFRYLLQNIKLNDLSEKVTPLNVAVGSAEGRLRLTEGLGTENYVSPQPVSGGVEVDATTLDKTFVNAVPALIKVDVEGFETEVFAGAERLLTQPSLKAMIVERGAVTGRYTYDENELHRRIQAQFIPCAYSGMKRELSRIPSDANGNIIYVRDFQFVQEKVKGATSARFAGTAL